ncbi:MAG: hypothetical protein M1816_003424 [Peltula sp. TS41687]|nr:MAG: hypothetical protein M1816_003424 [Peltula sp. TS41687]
MDLPTSPTSPLRHHFTSRPKNSYNGYFTSSPTTSTTTQSPHRRCLHEQRKQAAQRELAGKVRNDWVFHWTDVPNRPSRRTPSAGFVVELEQNDAAAGRTTTWGDENDWRERDFSSPCPTPPSRRPGQKYIWSTEDPQSSPETHVRNKRRRRRNRLEEEMSWNANLRHWMAQRDAWTGGRVRLVYHRSAAVSNAEYLTATTTTANTAPFADARRSSINDPRSVSYSYNVDVIEEVPMPSAPLLSISPQLREANKTPENRAQIYKALVREGKSPWAPVNLADVTYAIVAGWKADKTWDEIARKAAAAEDAQRLAR